MTREEFFEKGNSINTELHKLHEKESKLTNEYETLVEENAEKILGVKNGDCIYYKVDGEWYEIYDIDIDSIDKDNFILSIEHLKADYNKCITEKEFFDEFLTQEKYDEIQNQKKEDSEYQEYLRLKEKYE